MVKLFICHPILAYQAFMVGARLAWLENKANNWR